jgi:hypothetical protein
MDYSVEELPTFCFEASNVAVNFQTRNARFRKAVCQHLRLQWVSVHGSGNCFFESVIALLRAADRCPETLNARELRHDVLQFFRACIGSTQDFCERVMIEIEDELHEKLVNSTRAKVNGYRVNGFVPETIQSYLDAVEQEGTWVQGWHWLRAISFLYDVRVAVVIFGHAVVRFFGQGPVTIYLYKVDAETHYDPLLPLPPDDAAAADPTLTHSNTATDPTSSAALPVPQCTLTHSNTATDPTSSAALPVPQCTLTHPNESAIFIISSSSSISDSEQKTRASSRLVTMAARKQFSNLVQDEDAPLTKQMPVAAAPSAFSFMLCSVHSLTHLQCVALPECSAATNFAAAAAAAAAAATLILNISQVHAAGWLHGSSFQTSDNAAMTMPLSQSKSQLLVSSFF